MEFQEIIKHPFVWGLALAERVGGKPLFDRALGWLAVLRIVIAGVTALGLM